MTRNALDHRTPDAEPPAGSQARTLRRVTAGAAVAAALAGVAVAGTLAGAEQGAPKATTATKPLTAKERAAAKEAAQKAAEKKKAAVKKKRTSRTVHVLIKRGRKGTTGATGKTGATGPQGPAGPQGPQGAAATDVARSFTLNWNGNPAGRDTAGADVPAVGRLNLTCNPTTSELHLTPSRADMRTVLTTDTYSGTSGDHHRYESTGATIVVPLPVSGLITATMAVEPAGGDGGPGPAPATLTLSVESKSNANPNDPQDANFCFAAGQVLQASR